jgi:RNA-binding motif protein, X-linked 2
LPYDLSEGDIVTIFSQFGEPVHVNLVRDKETGKSRGFAFLKYEDQRSTDLAVDNLGGATVLGRLLRVDHVRYKRREEEGDVDNVAALTGAGVEDHRHRGEENYSTDGERRRPRGSRESDDEAGHSRPMLKEERELAGLIRDHDEEDPMKEYLIQEKKEEVARALEKQKISSKRTSLRGEASRERAHRHRYHHHHRHHRRQGQSEQRSRSRERSTKERPAPHEPRFNRDRSLSRDRYRRDGVYRERERYQGRPRSRERYHEERPLLEERESYKNQSRTTSQSPVRRREHRKYRDR